jgi:hypothetical protein
VGTEYRELYKKYKKYHSWMNEELDIIVQQELERRIREYESELAK